MKRAFWIRAALLCLGAGALELACRTGHISRVSLIAPSEMVTAAWAILASGRTDGDLLFSLYNVILATLISILGGFTIGASIRLVPRLRGAIDPILAAYYAVPTFVLYPVLIMLFGIGSAPLIVIGSLFGIVSMIVNTLIGLDSVPSSLLHTAAVLRLSPLRTLVFVQVPAASLYLVGGAKLAVAYSIIGIVAGEFILSTHGIGKQIAFAYNDFNTPAMYGYLVLLLGTVIAINLGIQRWENALRRRWAL